MDNQDPDKQLAPEEDLTVSIFGVSAGQQALNEARQVSLQLTEHQKECLIRWQEARLASTEAREFLSAKLDKNSEKINSLVVKVAMAIITLLCTVIGMMIHKLGIL